MAKKYWVWVECESMPNGVLLTQVEEDTPVLFFLAYLVQNKENGIVAKPWNCNLILPDGSCAAPGMKLKAEILSGKPKFQVVVREEKTSRTITELYGCPLAQETVGVIPECMIEHPVKGTEWNY